MMYVAATKKLDDGRMLVVAANPRAKHQQKEFYSVDKENVDKFIKGRKAADTSNSFQKITSFILATTTGFLSAKKLDTGKAAKGVIGLAAGYGVFKALQPLDKMINSWTINNISKKNDAINITKEMTKNY